MARFDILRKAVYKCGQRLDEAMRISTFVLPFFIASQVVWAAKSSGSGKSVSDTDIVTSQLAKLELNRKTNSLDTPFRCEVRLKLKQLNTFIGEELEEGSIIFDALDVTSNYPLFRVDQILHIKRAIKKGYNNYLKCMLTFKRLYWQAERDYHVAW
jgi:hypothetical protein